MTSGPKSPSPLRRLRSAMGWSRAQVARAAEVTERTVARIEGLSGLSGLKLGTLVRVAQAVGLSPGELVPGLVARPKRRSPRLPAPPPESAPDVPGLPESAASSSGG